MVNVQVRNVPDDVHERLKAQAADAGQSLNELTLSRLSDIARLPTLRELAARLRSGEPYTGPSSASVIRADRDAR